MAEHSDNISYERLIKLAKTYFKLPQASGDKGGGWSTLNAGGDGQQNNMMYDLQRRLRTLISDHGLGAKFYRNNLNQFVFMRIAAPVVDAQTYLKAFSDAYHSTCKKITDASENTDESLAADDPRISLFSVQICAPLEGNSPDESNVTIGVVIHKNVQQAIAEFLQNERER
ncbi:MAG: hypothetical protein SFX19_00885 [Alphaproteobacteria bacterium]|nr:hypothetical protein [Alphaproteobacteria bacterium]